MLTSYKKRKLAGALARVRFAGSKAFSKRAKTSRRSSRAYKLSSTRRYNLHDYVRYSDTIPTYDLSNPSTSQGYCKSFAMSETVNYSELTNLYDQYKIVGVKMTFQLMNCPEASYTVPNATTNQSLNFYPKLWYCRDYDNTDVETLSALRQRNGTKCKILRPNKMISVFLKPAVRVPLYLDGVTNAYSPEWDKWIDCSNPTVPYTGLKFVIDANGYTPSAGNSLQVKTEIKYYLKFKNVR